MPTQSSQAHQQQGEVCAREVLGKKTVHTHTRNVFILKNIPVSIIAENFQCFHTFHPTDFFVLFVFYLYLSVQN